jgi:hypothetical protein
MEVAMPALVEIQSTTGTVLFEGEFSEAALRQIAVEDKVDDVVKTTGARLSTLATTIRNCTRDLLDTFDDLATEKRSGGAFSSAIVELGIKVTAEGNVIVAKGSAEGNLKVTLSWDFA